MDMHKSEFTAMYAPTFLWLAQNAINLTRIYTRYTTCIVYIPHIPQFSLKLLPLLITHLVQFLCHFSPPTLFVNKILQRYDNVGIHGRSV